MSHAGCLAINMKYHDTMFAYSELANTFQEHVDINVANGLKKVYIGSPYSLAFNEGDHVLIYRKYTGKGETWIQVSNYLILHSNSHRKDKISRKVFLLIR